jgi:hypothetical protein
MAATSEHERAPRTIGRRAALRRLGGVALAIGTSGCAREFVLHAIYPEAGGIDADEITRLLTAFVDTIVPGAERPERIAGLMGDRALPFAPFCGALAADLSRRTQSRIGQASFDRLPRAERTAVVVEALAGGGIPARIYNGAVLFAQAAVYAGLASDDGSCAITGFEGPFRFRGYAAQTYPDPENFLPAPKSADGNPE